MHSTTPPCAHLYVSLEELQVLTDTWVRVYNQERPHDSLGRMPPLRGRNVPKARDARGRAAHYGTAAFAARP